MTTSSAMEKVHGMVATSALYNGKRNDDYTGECHEGTREKYLGDLMGWADKGPAEQRVQWVRAVAGAGKTAMLRTFCTKLKPKATITSASFFIWKNDPTRNTLDHFPATIASQFCRSIPALVSHVEKAINDDPFLLKSTFEEQMEQLVVIPLLNVPSAVKESRHVIIVIDGVDELDTRGQQDLLRFIPPFLSKLSTLPISILLSSRPESQILGAFRHPNLASITRSTRLGESDEDIMKFLDDKFEDLNLRFPYLKERYGSGGRWPSQERRAIMVKQSSGLFIWPTVAMDYIDKAGKGLQHNERLELVLSTSEPKPWIGSPLDYLYWTILRAHAPEDRESAEFFKFTQRMAYLCLPVEAGYFVFEKEDIEEPLVDLSDTPIRAVFGETLDEVWDSMADFTSIFSPREPPSDENSPLPMISHRTFRDFTFNRLRCGDEFYYRDEGEVHSEVICKFIDFFNRAQHYKNSDMSGQFIKRTRRFLASHSGGAAFTEELGHCMDDISTSSVPTTWPLVAQICMFGSLIEVLHNLASLPGFTDGTLRQEALLSKLEVFIHSRVAAAPKWDVALFRLTMNPISTNRLSWGMGLTLHSPSCVSGSYYPQCQCVRALQLCRYSYNYREYLPNHLAAPAVDQIMSKESINYAQHSLDIMKFILSISETSERGNELVYFIPVCDAWIPQLIASCTPDAELYGTLEAVCTIPLFDLPSREGDTPMGQAQGLLSQRKSFLDYAERCREAGIETKLTPVKVPDSWWQNEDVVSTLKAHGYSREADADEKISENLAVDGVSSHQGPDDTPSFPIVITVAAPHVEPGPTVLALSTLDVEKSAEDEVLLPPVPSLQVDTLPEPAALIGVRKHVAGGDVGDVQTRPSDAVRHRRRGGVRHFFKGLVCWP